MIAKKKTTQKTKQNVERAVLFFVRKSHKYYDPVVTSIAHVICCETEMFYNLKYNCLYIAVRHMYVLMNILIGMEKVPVAILSLNNNYN